MREVEYAKLLDADFKKFLAQKKRGKSVKENMDDRAGALITETYLLKVRWQITVG